MDAGAQATSHAAGIGVTAHATSVPSHGPPGPAARVPMLESPIRSPLILAAAQPLPSINHCCGGAATIDSGGAPGQRATCAAVGVHAVYRESGGVPSPPNLEPKSHAGSATSRVPPGRAGGSLPGGRCALTWAGSAWQAEAGSRGCGSAARDQQRAGRHATWRWCRRRCPSVGTSGAVPCVCGYAHRTSRARSMGNGQS